MQQTPHALPSAALYQRCDPASLSFDSTEELEPLKEIPGQQRAIEALRFAAGIDIDGHNVFVLGETGSGRHDFVQQFLGAEAAAQEVPHDWVYVYNFDDPRRPRALALPPGRAVNVRDDVRQLIADAQSALPEAFESDDFQARRETIAEAFKEAQEAAFKEVEEEAGKHDIGIVHTPSGVAFVPVRDDEALGLEAFQKLPEEEQKKYHEDIERLTRQLQHVMRAMPKRAREMRQQVRQLERDVARLAVSDLIEELVNRYSDIPAVVEHLQRMQDDIVDQAALFLPDKEEQGLPAAIQAAKESAESAAMRRYSINVMVDRSDAEGAPVVLEDKPSFAELIGRIEHESEFGSLVTNFGLIRPGTLHQANGGYLVLDAERLLTYPLAYDGLKRALRTRKIRIRSLADDAGWLGTVTLEPEPIPLEVKVVLIGERRSYYLLQQYDPEFSELFKVAADFDDRIPRNSEHVEQLARWLAATVRREGLRHLDRSGVARLVEDSARSSGDAERLSAGLHRAADLVREAHYLAGRDGNQRIGSDDIQAAIDARTRRGSRVRDRLQEELLRGTYLVETEGERAGQINGLAVMQLGDLAFGRPQRITASVTLGGGEVIDIEREVKLGGPLHSKGVLILSGFLRARYVTDQPLSLAASLVFEQSYGGVDGDSASAAELCALLSALSGVPIRQALAITGSVDQHGRVQAIGGVNEKIEGFFDICQARGLDGSHGVLIPRSNVKHLMLRQDVVEAVDAGCFGVFAVDHVDQALGLLTGRDAGALDAEGQFPADSVNGLVRDRLRDLAERRRSFGKEKDRDGDSD